MNLPVVEFPHLKKNNLTEESLPWDSVVKIAQLISVEALYLNRVNMLMHLNTCRKILQIFSHVSAF